MPLAMSLPGALMLPLLLSMAPLLPLSFVVPLPLLPSLPALLPLLPGSAFMLLGPLVGNAASTLCMTTVPSAQHTQVHPLWPSVAHG